MRQIFLVFAIFCISTVYIAFAQSSRPFRMIGLKYYYIENHQKLNWFGAATRCLELDGNLATIENEVEMQALSSHLMTQGYTESDSDWIWISGLGVRGNFLVFSNPPKLLPYAKWWTNQPDDFGSAESCMNLYRKGNQFYMNDWNCRREAFFICEAQAKEHVPTWDVRSELVHKRY